MTPWADAVEEVGHENRGRNNQIEKACYRINVPGGWFL